MQRNHLGYGENILHNRAGANAACIHEGEQEHDGDGQELLCGQTEFAGSDEIISGRDGGHEDACKLCERHGYGGDGAGLDDDEGGPAEEEGPEATEGFAEINVLSAGLRHGGGKFAIAERGDDGQHGGDEPADDEQAGRLHLAGDIGAHDKNAGADHGAHDESGGIEQAEAFDEAAFAGIYDFSFCHSLIRSRRVVLVHGAG